MLIVKMHFIKIKNVAGLNKKKIIFAHLDVDISLNILLIVKELKSINMFVSNQKVYVHNVKKSQMLVNA